MQDELNPSQTAANPCVWVGGCRVGWVSPAQGHGSHGMWGLVPPRWAQPWRFFPRSVT